MAQAERIWLDGVAYVKERASIRNDKRVLDNTGVLYCNICGGTVKVSEAMARDVRRTNTVDDVTTYYITGHQKCVDLYQKRC